MASKQEEDETYTGVWMTMGCILGGLALASLFFIIAYFMYMALSRG